MGRPSENALVKSAYKKIAYTEQDFNEFRNCADKITGPEYFMRNFFYIKLGPGGRSLFNPFDYQVELLNNYIHYRHSINLLGRQMGKCCVESTVINIKHNKTGKIYDIPIGKFYQYQKDSTIDISEYERKNI